MKKIIGLVVAVVTFCSTGCETHEMWGEGSPEMEHVYIFLLDQPVNQITDFLEYEVAQNGTARWRFGAKNQGTWAVTEEQRIAKIPFSFRSERVRTYDVTSYVWVESTLIAGTDFTVTLEDGTVITPNANGGYPLTWPQAKRAVQSIKIKRTQGSPSGKIQVQTFNSANGMPVISNVASLVNNKTDNYEVRCITYDINKVTVNFN